MNIRPSSLPKLALCGQYEGAKTTSEAASRGTKLDGIFRDAWQTGEFPREIDEVDRLAVYWALNQMILLSGNRARVETADKKCKIKIPGMEHVGTADAICAGQRWHADLKTGQIYNYEAQMAAYALGLMEAHNCSEWTAHLLFCDQQEVRTHKFSRSDAAFIVAEIIGNVGSEPVINDYCGWCSKSMVCPPRLAAQETALATSGDSFLQLIEDPARLGDFLNRCKILADFEEAAKAKARGLLESGIDVPGWRLQKPRISEFVSADVLAAYASELDPIEIIRAQGSLSAKKAKELWAKAGLSLPAGAITSKQSQAPMVQA